MSFFSSFIFIIMIGSLPGEGAMIAHAHARDAHIGHIAIRESLHNKKIQKKILKTKNKNTLHFVSINFFLNRLYTSFPPVPSPLLLLLIYVFCA